MGRQARPKIPNPECYPQPTSCPWLRKASYVLQISSAYVIDSDIRFSLTADTWSEYGNQWKDYYNTKIAGKPIPTSGPTLPPLPNTDAAGEDWATWGKAVAKAWDDYATERGVDLPEVLKGLPLPELKDGDWAAYSKQWSDYSKQIGERFQVALAAKSA